MKQVLPGIFYLSLQGMVNVYLIQISDGLMLVDAGAGGQAGRILKAVDSLAKKHGRLQHMVITHGHGDHIGGAAAIQAQTGAKIWMHPADAGALTTGAGNAHVMPGKMNLLQRITTRKIQAAEVDEHLADGVLPFDFDWQVHHTPGHTAGQCCLFNPVLKVLGTGDAVMHFLGRLRQPFKMASVNREQNLVGVKRLSQLDFDTALFGHGPTIQGDAHHILRDWLSRTG